MTFIMLNDDLDKEKDTQKKIEREWKKNETNLSEHFKNLVSFERKNINSDKLTLNEEGKGEK